MKQNGEGMPSQEVLPKVGDVVGVEGSEFGGVYVGDDEYGSAMLAHRDLSGLYPCKDPSAMYVLPDSIVTSEMAEFAAGIRERLAETNKLQEVVDDVSRDLDLISLSDDLEIAKLEIEQVNEKVKMILSGLAVASGAVLSAAGFYEFGKGVTPDEFAVGVFGLTLGSQALGFGLVALGKSYEKFQEKAKSILNLKEE